MNEDLKYLDYVSWFYTIDPEILKVIENNITKIASSGNVHPRVVIDTVLMPLFIMDVINSKK